jgi:peptidoglycan/xylan/chitin deacetylase (PgdA/CDA1 family)
LNSIFTISLDFELHWGVFDKRDRAAREGVYKNTLQLVPRLLDLFEENGIGVTWATVGSLFCENEEEWRSLLPSILPHYDQEKFDPYAYAQRFGLGEEVRWAHFAPEMVKRIAQYLGQELATHTFSHYYCLEKGQTAESFSADLSVVQQLAVLKTGRYLTSLVFPRNQYNETYLHACADAGILVIRSNPGVWYWSGIGNDDTSMLRKVVRTADVYVPMGKRMSYPLKTLQAGTGLPLSLPASRLLRQYDPRYPVLNRLRLKRILGEMTSAASHGECYHLWWHPENFGSNPEECMQELGELISHYRKLNNDFGMISKPMNAFSKSNPG